MCTHEYRTSTYTTFMRIGTSKQKNSSISKTSIMTIPSEVDVSFSITGDMNRMSTSQNSISNTYSSKTITIDDVSQEDSFLDSSISSLDIHTERSDSSIGTSSISQVLDGQQPGHIDNLTPEQVRALYLVWNELLKCIDQWEDVIGGEGLPLPLSSICSISSKNTSKSTLNSSSKGKGRWSLFKKSSSSFIESQSTNSSSFYSVSSVPIDDTVNTRSNSTIFEDPILHTCKNPIPDRLTNPIPNSQSIAGHIPKSTFSEELWRGLLNGISDPDITVLRFLRARKWNLNAAINMLFSTIEWRSIVGVFDLVRKGDEFIDARLWESGKSFFYGTDKHGRTVIYVIARKHDKNVPGISENQKFTIFLMEIARKLMAPGTETVTLVFDMSGFTMSNMDFSQVKFLVNCFQSFYPESLGKCYIVTAPWIFWTAWKLIKPLLDPVVSSKIFFLKSEELVNHIDSSMLAKCVSSSSTYEYQFSKSNSSNKNQMNNESFERLQQDFVACKNQLIFTTKTISDALKNDLSSSDIVKLLDDLSPVIEQRNALKRRWRDLSLQLDFCTIPDTMYHRQRILDSKTGTINWNKACV